MDSSNYNVVLKPLNGSQSLALSCPANEILYEGTRGASKTAAQLMRFRRLVGLGYGAFWTGVIFDLKFKNLSDIIAQSKKLFNRFDDGARFLSSASSLKWIWPTGEELMFRAEINAEGYWNYHGQELPFIGHNELTKRPDPEFYESMFSCMRTAFRPEDYPMQDGRLLPKIPLECFSTTNPFGVGHSWVKKEFIDPVPRGTVQRKYIEVQNPSTGENETITLTRVAIHGSWRENPYLDPTYIAFLNSIKDPNKKAAWAEGSWDITSGGRFDHLWRPSVHVIKPFKIPAAWKVDRSHDWGQAKPFSCLWFAEADGTEADIGNGKKFCPASGSIICIAELYGCLPEEHNKGLNMSAANVAKMTAWIDKRLAGSDDEQPITYEGECRLVPNSIEGEVVDGPADNSINNNDDEQISIADKMEDEGITWTASDKSAGSRVNGAALLCEMLEAALEGAASESGNSERPALYFFETVRGIISRFPVLSRDTKNPDDIDCFVAGTMINTEFGALPIQNISVGIKVKTPIGLMPVTNSELSGKSETVTIKFECGERLKGTPNHQIYVDGVGLVRLKDVKRGAILTKNIMVGAGIWTRLIISVQSFINERIGGILNAAQQRQKS